MKHRIKQILSLSLAVSMLLSLIPLYGAAMIDEFEGLETIEEIPFEFVLEPGDLPRELLREAVLAPEDLPSCIDPELAEARGHVNRLYLQEPDDRTVMFQNRDGSKTVYLFSHPVKGMSASTVSSFEISGTRLSFTFNNAITSRVGVTLSNFNIGYAEVAYIPGGVLTEDGVNITEDVRDWARGESTVSALAYNISGEAAAEYAASVAVPETDVAATAAAAPGITITPNDPAPLGGMTVMSISYSDLAGLMSFKNMSTNRYLAITTSSTPSLTTSVRIVASYSRWLVQYDSMRGYILCNFKDIHNTFIGRMAGQNTVTMGPKTSIDYVFGLTIVSTTDGTVTIGNNDYALDSTLSAYQKNPDDDAFPTACEWKIYSKENVTLATSVTAPSSLRLEQKGVGFALDYTVNPSNATHYDVELYYAATNQPVERDTEVYEDDDYLYYINTPGVHTLYYKDMITGVTSVEFTMIITETSGAGQPVNFPSNHTYAIQPYGYGNLFLTMTDNDGIGTTQNSFSVESLITEWDDQSQTFVFNTATGDSYSRTIFATLSTVQSGAPANYRTPTVYQYTQPYGYPNVDYICNSLSYFQGSEYPEGVEKSAPESVVQIYDLGGYYVISFGLSSNNKLLALKYDTNAALDEDNVIVAEYSPADTTFRWNITYVGIDTPLIKQTHSAGCGATATLMYTYGMGLDEIDSTDNLTALQTELRTALNFNLDTYIIVYNITNYINGMYQDLNINPQFEYCDDYTLDTEQLSKLSNNIANQNIMIARVTMLDLNYYDSNVRGTYHYVNVVGKIVINGVNNYVVMDCHYDDTYFGIHIIDEEELVGAITHLIAKQ